MTQKRKGECGEEYAARNIKCRLEGRIKDMDPKALLQIKNYTAAANALRDAPLDLPEGGRGTYHEWHYSEMAGTGKSRHCRKEQKGSMYIHEGNCWWDDYEFEDVVYFDDISGDGRKLMDKLKQALDESKFRAQVKGGMIYIRPKKVIISSNCHPMEIWPNKHGEAILDRVRLIDWGTEKFLLPDNTPNPKWVKPEGLNQTWWDLQPHP